MKLLTQSLQTAAYILVGIGMAIIALVPFTAAVVFIVRGW